MNYLTRSSFYGLCPLVKLLLGFSWIEKGGLFNSKRYRFLWDLSIRNRISRWQTTKILLCEVTVMNLALRWSFFVCTFSVDLKFFCYGWGRWGGGGGGGAEIRTCTTCCLRDIKDMETVKQSSI